MEAMTRLLDVAYEKGIKVCGNDKADLRKDCSAHLLCLGGT
jgi:hypothetical protein